MRALTTKEEDSIRDIFISHSHNYVFFFSDQGRVYVKKCYEIPEAGRTAKGTNLVNVLNLKEGEKITAFLSVPQLETEDSLVFVTRCGLVKKTPLRLFRHIRRDGVKAITLEEGDLLLSVFRTDGTRDLIIATDPDADRVGVMARTRDGDFKTITGNQMGALLLDYIITAYEETNTMPSLPYAVKSVVSTELATKICESHGVEMFNVLTGFKFIGEVIKNHEKSGEGSFIFGFEESYGYLKGTYARDKDAVVTSMLICEMTAYYYSKGMTLCDALDVLYGKYGFCRETNVEIYMEGIDGPSRMAALLDGMRENTPRNLGGVAVKTFGDYKAECFVDMTSGERFATGLPCANMLCFKLENGDVVIVRPSGTEPKVKFYFLVIAPDKNEADSRIDGYKLSLGL
jgi:phosphomannomutase